MPGHDLVTPLRDSAAEATHLDRHFAVGEVTDDLINPGDSQGFVGVLVWS